jgi:putative N6-adenine-specific DNA methylase
MKQSDSGLFFIQLPPPFEKQTLWEMEQKGFPTNQAKIFKGGIEIELPLQMGFSMNHSLKTPNRILLRLASFKCRDFPKLYKNAQKIPWNQILRTEKVKINSTSKKSRLIHTDRINQTMEDAIEKFFIAQPQKKQFLENPAKDIPEVFVRIIDDECTISIDTSGERLSKRGREIQASSAPLRENLAACLLTKLLQEKNLSPTLIDPCCGSGTFLKEARDYFKLSKRNFAYQDFPFLRTPLKINENHNKLYEKLMGRDLIETSRK